MNTITKNIMYLFSGTIIAQAIPFIFSPILSRLYDPSEFGMYSTFVATSSILSVIISGCYELAIVLPPKNADAINVLGLSFFINMTFSFLLFIIIAIGKSYIISNFSSYINLGYLIYIIPLFVFFNSAYQALNYWNIRKKEFKRIAANKILQSFSVAFSNIVFAVCHIGGGLIWGAVIGVVSSLSRFIYHFKNEDTNLIKEINKNKVKEQMHNYCDFPKKTLFSTLINSIYNNGKFLILAIFFDKTTIGQLAICFRVLQAPTAIISSSIADVFFKEAADLINSNKYNELRTKLLSIFVKLIGLAMIPSLLLILWGESLFGFVFGYQWSLSGKMASIMSISLLFQISVAPFCKVFYALKKQNLYLCWEMIRCLLVYLPVIYFCLNQYNIFDVLKSMTVTISISYSILLLFLIRITQNEHK